MEPQKKFKKMPPTEIKKRRRIQQCNLKLKVETHFASKATMSFLSENECFQGYCRKCIQQSFVETTKSRKRSHIPKVEKTLKYKSLVIDQLSEIPPDSLINWSEIGRKCKGKLQKRLL